LSKKITLLVFFILILFAGIIAVTQESNIEIPARIDEGFNAISSAWVKPPVWFRSNAAGMAIEETGSRVTALRNEYALEVVFARQSEIPPYISRYYDENYLPEIRRLYNNSSVVRTQWILRDIIGITRVNAVFTEGKNSGLQEEEDETYNAADIKGKSGFIEIYDKDSLLITEYRFFEDGAVNRTVNEFNNNHLTGSVVSYSDDDGGYQKFYADSYRYNRSLSLRSIERVFFTSVSVTDLESVVSFASEASGQAAINFPRRLLDAARNISFVSGKLNIYPEFFSGAINENDKIIYETDDRGRILNEALYDDDGKVIWVIRNTWENNRIVSTLKIEYNPESFTEGAAGFITAEFLAEYEYNNDGDRLLERNYKNGRLERVVRAEGNQEIEELFINNVIVMTAVWEDGRKISESRFRQAD